MPASETTSNPALCKFCIRSTPKESNATGQKAPTLIKIEKLLLAVAKPEEIAYASKPRQVTPVILCGGTGTRLWPLSRASYPKQYWALAGSGEETLLQQTHQRLAGINGLQLPLLICNEDHRFNCYAEAKGYVAEQMRPSRRRFRGRAGLSCREYADNQ